MQSRQPLTLLWLRPDLEIVLEAYFIKEVLLAEIGRPIRTLVIEANAPIPFLNDVLVVSFGPNLAGYVKEARARGLKNVGLLHLADELGDHDRSFYADVDYVFRNYWFKQALVPPSPQSLGAYWIPNGYRTGVGPISPQTMLSTADRKITGFFSGVLQGRTNLGERKQMLDVVTESKLPFLVAGTPGFGQGLGPVAYAAFMGMSRFALVPAGNSPETIRLYDALEAGAIPIMVRADTSARRTRSTIHLFFCSIAGRSFRQRMPPMQMPMHRRSLKPSKQSASKSCLGGRASKPSSSNA